MWRGFKLIIFLLLTCMSSYCVYSFIQTKDKVSSTVYQRTAILPNPNFENASSSVAEDFFHEETSSLVEDPLMILEIPRLSLKLPVYAKESIQNHIDRNVQLMKESDLPNIAYGNVILGGHSGNSRVSYFKNLDQLQLGDEIIIHYSESSYFYRVVSSYQDNKDGKIVIRRDPRKDNVTLYTCFPGDSNHYLVIIAEKVLT